MAYPTSGVIGASLSLTHTEAKFEVGKRVAGTDGTVWIYVKAAEAITQYAALAITSAHQASQITTTNAALARYVGIAQVAFASADYGWVAIDGSGLYCLIDGTTDILPGVLLAPSGINAGLLAINSISTQQVMAGIRTVTTASTLTATTEVVLNNPHVILNRS